MATHSEHLADVPFFSLLDDQARAVLADRLDVVTMKAGTVMFNFGDPGGTLFVLRKGVVELFVRNDVGERIVLETDYAGDFFGETSLLDGGPRSASAIVIEDMEALVLGREDLDAFFRIQPAAAMDVLAAIGRRLRETSSQLRRVTKNVNDETEDKRTAVMKAADWISDFSGSLPFLFIHCAIFVGWILLNTGAIGERWGNFDPYPFGLLTMVVSLEAIILSVFVLLSQNRQAARERVRNEIEYAVNLKAELEISHMHVKVDDNHAELIARIARIEQALASLRPRE